MLTLLKFNFQNDYGNKHEVLNVSYNAEWIEFQFFIYYIFHKNVLYLSYSYISDNLVIRQ